VRQKNKNAMNDDDDDFYSRASSFSTGIQSRFVSANRTFETHHARALPDETLYSLPRLNAKTGEIEKNLHFRNDETYENVLIGQALPGLTIAGLLLASIAVTVVLKSGALLFFSVYRWRRSGSHFLFRSLTLTSY